MSACPCMRYTGISLIERQDDLPANTITPDMNNTLVRLRIQLWRLAHEDLMVFVCEEGWIGLWRFKRHYSLQS
jgi:hypothetical protein